MAIGFGNLPHLLQQLQLPLVGLHGLPQGGPRLGFFQVEEVLFAEFGEIAVAVSATQQQIQLGPTISQGTTPLLLLLGQAPLVHLEGAGKGLDRAEQPLLKIGDHQTLGVELPLAGAFAE